MKEAKELYEKAANSATLSTNFRDSFFKIEAQFRLGMLLVRGEGEPVNHLQRARHYLTLAAQAGHPQAAAELSKRFSIDVPKPKDSLLSSLARGWWSFAGVEDAPHR